MLSSSTEQTHTMFRFISIWVLFFLLACAVPASAQPQAAAPAEYEKLNRKVIDLYKKGQYKQALPFAMETLQIAQDTAAATRVVQALNNLAQLRRKLGHHEDAELLYLRAINISVQNLGKNHSTVAILLSNLATLYQTLGNLHRAEMLYRRALTIWQEATGPEHPRVIRLVGVLAALQNKQQPGSSAKPIPSPPAQVKKADPASDRNEKTAGRKTQAVLSKLP